MGAVVLQLLQFRLRGLRSTPRVTKVSPEMHTPRCVETTGRTLLCQAGKGHGAVGTLTLCSTLSMTVSSYRSVNATCSHIQLHVSATPQHARNNGPQGGAGARSFSKAEPKVLQAAGRTIHGMLLLNWSASTCTAPESRNVRPAPLSHQACRGVRPCSVGYSPRYAQRRGSPRSHTRLERRPNRLCGRSYRGSAS